MTANTTGQPGQGLSSTSGSDLARVRDNQRRSRARRKEYLQELESKLRKCEAAGVQASIGIQLAARGVTEENARLREEIERLKKENEQLRHRVRKSEEEAKASHQEAAISKPQNIGQTCGGVLEKAANADRTQPYNVPAQNFSTIHRDVITSPVSLANNPPQEQSFSPPSITPANAQSHAMRNQDITLSAGPSYTYTALTEPGTTEQSSCAETMDSPPFGHDTSSCEYAAAIITSMRDVSADEVRAALGCPSDIREWRKCKVDNSRLFATLDRYTR